MGYLDRMRDVLAQSGDLDEATSEYVVSMAESIVGDGDPKACEEDLRESLGPFCGGGDDNGGGGGGEDSLLEKLIRAATTTTTTTANGGGANGAHANGSSKAGGDEDEDDEAAAAAAEEQPQGPTSPRTGEVAVNLQGIILAYGTKSLLQQTNLVLVCGQRYALVGHNGAGKSTLMTRMAANNITGFPKHLRCAYVQHEIVIDRPVSVRDYMQEAAVACIEKYKSRPSTTTSAKSVTFSQAEQDRCLADVGFDAKMVAGPVSALSGGWRMRLAIAMAMLQRAHILLLDEPTNHLDRNAVNWLIGYLKTLKETTLVMVSHDVDFLEEVATDIMLFDDRRLLYFPAPFSSFLKKQEETRKGRETVSLLRMNKAGKMTVAKEGGGGGAAGGGGGEDGDAEDADETKQFVFPSPGPLDGDGSRSASRTRTVLRLKDLSFRYPGADRNALNNVNVRITLASRVGITGANGAGKSTLLGLIVGELFPMNDGKSKMTKHFGCRVAYIAQHSLHHLEEHLDTSPLIYFQRRFKQGIDVEAQNKVTLVLTEEERAMMKKTGHVEQVLGRHYRARTLEYEVKYCGYKDTVWCPLTVLEAKGLYAVKLCKLYDEQMAADAAGVGVRPITSDEVLKHLADFGLHKALATGKIAALSGGQRCRLVLAGAMWNRPHVICFDEPTNYLDQEALAMLAESIRTFKGAIVIVSHSESFVRKLCVERWSVEGGVVTCEQFADCAPIVRQPGEEDEEVGDVVAGDTAANDSDDEDLVEVVAHGGGAM